MTTLNNFQSVFELATGIHLGVSGLLAIFDDPRDRQLRYAARMLKSLRNLRQAAQNKPDEVRSELDGLISNYTKTYDEEIRSSQKHRTYTMAKILSVLFGLVGIFYVSYCSDHPDAPVDNLTWLVGHICLLSPVFIVFFSLLPAYRASSGIAVLRSNLDSAYDKMVFEVYKKGGATN